MSFLLFVILIIFGTIEATNTTTNNTLVSPTI